MEAFSDISFFHCGYFGFGKVDENVDSMGFFETYHVIDNYFSGRNS